MKIYKEDNVVVASEKRIERLFNEFPNVIVSFSGGKDSTAMILELLYERKTPIEKLEFVFLDTG